MLRGAAVLALIAVVGVALLSSFSRATAPARSALATTGCDAGSFGCEVGYPEIGLPYQSETGAAGAGELAGQFQIVGHTVFVGGCYSLDLHQVTYLGPDGSSTYVARWCG